MSELQRKMRLPRVGAVLITGVLCAAAFCYFRPFDSYLLKSWESELSTLPDQDVEVRLEQIAALGERSLPTLVAALHSERQVVAATAASVLRRTLAELELRSTDESSRIVAGLAQELAARSNRPGPHSAPASTQFATRLLLWPINRKLIDGERLVADCEVIIRSAKRTTRGPVAVPTDEDVHAQDGLASTRNGVGPAEILTPIAGGGLPMQLMDAPPLPPQNARILPQAPAATSTAPLHFIPVQAPRALDTLPGYAADEVAKQPTSQPPAVDSRESLELRRDTVSVPIGATVRPDLRAMADLDLMQKLADDNESLAREAVDELYRRGFQTKHFRLAELLVDPDPNVRLALVRRLPQMPGIDSRPWLLWLSRDQEPAVRKAAVAVIATSSDSALQRRVRELEREETDEEVLRTVRQILDTRQDNTIR
jgi:hypothetical protein